MTSKIAEMLALGFLIYFAGCFAVIVFLYEPLALIPLGALVVLAALMSNHTPNIDVF